MNTSGRSTNRAPRFVVSAIAVVALAALLGACGSSNETDASDAPAEAEITIRNFMFEPATLKVKVGTTVTVKNADDTPHTITADDNAFDTGSIAGGDVGDVHGDRGRNREIPLRHPQLHDRHHPGDRVTP